MTHPSKEILLNAVKEKILTELVCPLKSSAKSLVFGKGNSNATIMFIGEAPGEQEDIQGIPFVGSAGRELNKLLQLIHLTLDDAYIANILKYRPPGNRPPQKDEIKRHTPYLIEQIKIISPKIIVTLGNFATKFVLARFDPEQMKSVAGITQLHGKEQVLKIDEKEVTVVPMYHPAAMLYNPQLRVYLEQDFKKIGSICRSQSG